MSSKIPPYLKIVHREKHRTRIATFNELSEEGKCIISQSLGHKSGRKIVKYRIVPKNRTLPKDRLTGIPMGVILKYDIDADKYFLRDNR